jgi:Rps23 Pro-64 3,4-dihydroxylase Tpa1-like proline 4-hydroxylase
MSIVTPSHFVFSPETLSQLAENFSDSYQKAHPFPHAVFENVADPLLLKEALAVFPKPGELEFYEYNNPLEKKLAFDRIDLLPAPIVRILQEMSAPRFLRFLELLTGIEGLIPDPYFRGGGIHQIETGGKLDMHIDFNRYEKLQLDRRLNVILYLNTDWPESYGGHLELWSGHRDGQKHILNKCEERVLPIFNRLVVFSTSEKSYHGHPEPLTCPAGVTRKSIATYYYTNGYGECETEETHSTIFIKRPQDPDEPLLEQLRDKRNRGRLASNVESDHVAKR